MSRTPTIEGPPRCWGRYRGDDECAACPARGECKVAAVQFSKATTVAEAIAEQRARIGDIHQSSPEALAALAHKLFKEYGGSTFSRSWASDRKYVEAMRQAADMCATAKWDARTYVVGQMQTLIPMIQLGRRIFPGHFVGDRALDRFKGWVSRYEQRYGDARLHAEADAVAEQRQRVAATCAYMTARLYYEHNRDTALETAQGYCKDWAWDDVTQDEMLEGLNAAMVAIDPLLPHMVLMPTNDTWKWADMRDLFDRIRPPRAAEGSELVLSPSLGEML